MYSPCRPWYSSPCKRKAAPRTALTAHVPPAVASGQARLIGQLPADERLSLAGFP